MAIILMLIVAVAAFYLVAMLAMVVTDKRTDIAILRTLGASPRRVMAVFLIQGSVIGWFGVALGVLLGTVIGHNAGDVAAFLERLFRFEIFDSDGLRGHAPAVGAAPRADPVDRRHRHADHAARDYLPGVARRAHSAGRRAAVRIAWRALRMALRMDDRRPLPALRRIAAASCPSWPPCRCWGWRSASPCSSWCCRCSTASRRELRSRMLAVTSHATITGLDGAIPDWRCASRPRRRRSPA